MKQHEVYALTLELALELREKGSWCGETHLQKSMFFLENLANAPAGLDFVLYKHGPYSFVFHDMLMEMRTAGFLEYQLQPPYGPRIKPTEKGISLTQKCAKGISPWSTAISSVAACLGGKNVVELEKLGTALLLLREYPNKDSQYRAKKLHEVKPHVREEDALKATRELEDEILTCIAPAQSQ